MNSGFRNVHLRRAAALAHLGPAKPNTCSREDYTLMLRQTEERRVDQAFLEAVARTMQALDEHVNQYIAKRLAECNIQTAAALQLSPREREVFALVVQGLTNKEIATRLGISESTAKFHVSAILKKCGARSRLEVVREHKIAPALGLAS
jgi:RNA polymerase sigma factor (sigma-70 family)